MTEFFLWLLAALLAVTGVIYVVNRKVFLGATLIVLAILLGPLELVR